MNKIIVTTDKQEAIVTYQPIFSRLIEIEFIKPYEGLKVECRNDREDCNLYDPIQAQLFVESSVKLLIKQIHNVIRYRTVYQTFSDDYKRITAIMWSVLKPTKKRISPRDIFRYQCELQTRVMEELYSRLKTEIGEINAENEVEYLINPYLLNKILSYDR